MGVEPGQRRRPDLTRASARPDRTRALVYHGPDDLRLETVPLPEIPPGGMLVRIRACGLCASETIDWYMARKAPAGLGHEPVGEVVAVGEGVETFSPGDRVFVHHHAPCLRCRRCRRGDHVHCATWRRTRLVPGALSEFAVVPPEAVAADVLRLPPELSDEAAVFVEPLATVVKSLRRSRMRAGDRVLVIGLGVMGMLHALLARRLGAERVLGADRVASRLRRAREAGVEAIDVSDQPLAPAVRAATGGDGADVVIVGPGSAEAIQAGFEAAGAGSTVVLFTPAEPAVRWPLPVHDAYFGEVSVVPSYSCGPEDTREALRHLREGLPVEPLVTHRLPLAEAAEGYRLVRQAAQALKVVVRP